MKIEHINTLCDIIRETSFAIHRYHRHGHLEKIYENALAHRLRKQGIDVVQQHPLSVYDEDGTLLGDFYADLFVEQRLIVELKAVRSVASENVHNCSAISGRVASKQAYSSTSEPPCSM